MRAYGDIGVDVCRSNMRGDYVARRRRAPYRCLALSEMREMRR